MLKWNKLGLVFRQQGECSWRENSALTPTPILLDDETIRVYAGFRDNQGVSRIGYVDVDAHEPTQVKAISKQPVLDVGRAGCFDDNGIILGDIIRHNNTLRMYYVGFQLVKQVKFLAFTGIAESEDNGETFVRLMETPVLDRTHGATTIRAIHSAIYEDGQWKIWYAAGDDWQLIDNKPYPKYNIWYTESEDGISISKPGVLCVDVQGEEYRIGRPSVYKKNDQYYMFYTKGSISGKDYFPGLALSHDGINWSRKDHDFGMTLSADDFDSIHLCYPRLVQTRDKTYCFYNGNNMGVEGFGVAELLEW
ncbi:MAG: hypothetical protein P4L79_05110 [Legionella sp.]|uniref:hypothetical protein n=1 Tax=Legionella sp. TaxID=459 RepID=UPI0028408A20|nr:hypothetical protein [Legionella sp.]